MKFAGRLATAVLSLACVPLGAIYSPRSTVEPRQALVLYANRDYSSFDALISRADAIDDRTFDAFERAAKVWIQEAPSNSTRTLVAATVALEFAHRLRDKPEDWPAEYLVWASKIAREQEGVFAGDIGRSWCLAALAVMSELNDPWTLSAGEESGPSRFRIMARSLGHGGLLGFAQPRFRDEPRFEIAQLERDEWTRTRLEPVPEYLELVQRNARLRVPAEITSTDDATQMSIVETAVRTLQAVQAAAQVREAYASLRLPGEYGAEVQLHIGVLSMRAGSFADALQRLSRVQGATSDPFLLYLASHFEGRTFHYLGRREEAVKAFDRSLRYFPNARSSTTWLAALLFLSDKASDRERAAGLMAAAYHGAAVPDPWQFYGRSEGWRWATNIEALRQALK